MHEIMTYIVETLNRGRDLALATVVQKQGSAPRSVGAKMVLTHDPSPEGSVGGGALEAEVISTARDLVGTDQARLMDFMMTNQDASQEGMVCGGRVKLWLEGIRASAQNIELFTKALKCLEAGDTAWMINRLPGEPYRAQPALREFAANSKDGSLGGAAEALPSGMLEKARHSRKSQFALAGDAAFWLERIAPESILFLYGGGHVGQAVSALAAQCGFKVMVIDDRPEFANPALHPQADETRVIQDYARAVDLKEVNRQSYVAIMTRGHLHDYEVLAGALKTKAAYVGLMGSKKKISAIVARLKGDGFGDSEISRINTPIGLDIGAQTPAELAVSIVGELIAKRAGK
jgi:xanthine dehydrogenase accessory factor